MTSQISETNFSSIKLFYKPKLPEGREHTHWSPAKMGDWSPAFMALGVVGLALLVLVAIMMLKVAQPRAGQNEENNENQLAVPGTAAAVPFSEGPRVHANDVEGTVFKNNGNMVHRGNITKLGQDTTMMGRDHDEWHGIFNPHRR